MDAKPAKIRLSLREGLLEVEGSEEFVAKQIESLKDIFAKAPESMAPAGGERREIKPLPPGNTQPAAKPPIVTPGQYENLYSINGGTIKIIKEIPGESKPDKVVSAAMLYLFAKSFSGEAEALTSEIRQVCKDHGFPQDDGGNFSRTLKSQRETFDLSGSGRGKKAKLTVPGLKSARALAEKLSAQ